MRKIGAYLVAIVTLIALMIFAIPTIKESTNFAMEYTGGFEVLYKTSSKMDDVKDKDVAKTISDGMKKLLDINGVRDTIVTVEDNNYIRVNVTSKNQVISDEIRDLIQNNSSYEISFRDAEDNLLATGDQILKEVGANYNGETNYYGYPIIYLNIKDVALLEDITSTVSSASDTHLVIWVGFEEGVDSYANIQTDSATAKKVIYNATVSSPLDEEVITITGNYTEDEAKNTVNLVNSGTYNYDLETVQIKSVNATKATTNRNLLLISMGVTTLIALAFMAIFFKLEGVYAIVSVLFNEFLTIFLFNKIVGVINPQVMGAFILTNVITFGLMFILLSRYKSVLKTSKSPSKAYRETYKKNGPIILDTCVVVLAFALVTYFLGTNAQNFAIMLSTHSIATFISLYLIERFFMYLTCDFFNKNAKAVIVAESAVKEENITNKGIITKVEKHTKPILFGYLGLVFVGFIVILITSLTIKAPFGFYGDAKSGSRIEIVANQVYFTNEAQVMEFFDKEEMSIELKSITLKTEDDTYHVIVTTDASVSEYQDYLKTQLESIYGENTDYEENYILYLDDYTPVSLLISFKSTIYTSSIALLVIAVYFALRYKYSYSLATIGAYVIALSSTFAIYGITRIPANSQTVVAISMLTVFSIFTLVPLFTRVKEYMKDTKKVYLSYEERRDCFERGRNSILSFNLAATIILDFIVLVTMFFDLANFSMYLAVILGSVLVLLSNMIFVPHIWILFENRHDRRKKTFKNKNISNSKYRTLDEQVFIGVND